MKYIPYCTSCKKDIDSEDEPVDDGRHTTCGTQFTERYDTGDLDVLEADVLRRGWAPNVSHTDQIKWDRPTLLALIGELRQARAALARRTGATE